MITTSFPRSLRTSCGEAYDRLRRRSASIHFEVLRNEARLVISYTSTYIFTSTLCNEERKPVLPCE